MNTRNFIAALAFVLLQTTLPAQEKTISDVKGYQFTDIFRLDATPVKDQYKSGTCWSFAATSFVESELLKLGYPQTDLSEMYFVYMAYLDKADRYVRHHGNANFGPGGQGHDVINAIKRSGLFTETEFPGLTEGETRHMHGELDAVLRTYLDAVIKAPDGKISQVWPKAFNSLLETYLGSIPKIKDGKTIPSEAMQKKYPDFNPNDYVEFTSYTHHPYFEAFDLEVPDNWSHNLYYNVPLDDLMLIMHHALKNGYTICWDADVSDKGFSHSNSVAVVPDKDPATLEAAETERWSNLTDREKNAELYDFTNPCFEKTITPEIRQLAFNNYSSTDDHLMHIIGISHDQNGKKYFITKNSWAANSNKSGGYLNVSEAYARLNTIAILIHKSAIPSEIKSRLKL